MNKRKLSLIFAVSLTGIFSVVQAELTNVSFNTRLQKHIDSATGRIITNAKASSIISDRNTSEITPRIQRNITNGFAIPVGPYQPTNGALVSSSKIVIPASMLEKGLCYLNPKRAAAALMTLPAMATGFMAKGYYDASSVEAVAPVMETVAPVIAPVASVVAPVGYSAKAQALFAQYANNEAIKNGLNSVVTGVKNHKQAVFGAAGLATFIGAMKAYGYYTTKPESTITSKETQTSNTTTPKETQTSEVKQVAPVVEKASVVEKMTVQEIAAKYTSDPADMLKAFRAHGYTKADVSQHTLKRLTKLNDGQCRFIVSRLS